jgi:hypothetical protein
MSDDLMADHISPQWRALFEASRHTRLQRRATEAGESVARYVERVELKMRDWVEDTAIRIRVREPGLLGFLQDGHYKVMEATGVSGGGLKDIKSRRKVECEVLGMPEDAPASDRPVSGYLVGSDETGAIATYGPVVLELDHSVRARALYLLGDLIDTAALTGGRTFLPQPVTRPSMDAGSGKWDLAGAATLADACGLHRYAEALVFGGVSPRDVTSITYTRGEQPSAEVRAFEQAASWLLLETHSADP